MRRAVQGEQRELDVPLQRQTGAGEETHQDEVGSGEDGAALGESAGRGVLPGVALEQSGEREVVGDAHVFAEVLDCEGGPGGEVHG